MNSGSERALAMSAPILAWGLLSFAGCGVAGDQTQGTAATEDGGRAEQRRIVVVTHGQSADPFWSVVANGARDAGSDLSIRIEYQAPGTFNMVEMSQLIDAAVASRPDGLAVSIPDGDALASSLRKAVNAGIPVVSINSGDAVFRELGLHTHIGLPERDAGAAAGRRLGAAGVKLVLCVNHEVGNLALDARCAGLEDGLHETGGTMRVLAVDLADPVDAQQRIRGALARDPAIDGLLTLGPAGAVPALAALRTAGAQRAVLAAFDLSMPVLEAIREGELSFAVDQQPYLQGYLAVVILHNQMRIGTAPEGVIRTGPAFVTRENAAEVIRRVGEGVR